MSEDEARQVIRGGNHTIEVRDDHVHAWVYKREDVSLEEGARFALDMADSMSRLVELPIEEARYAIVDLSAAPSISGPITRAAMGRLIAKWEEARRPIVIVVGTEPIKDVLYHGIVLKHAPEYGRVTATVEEAIELAHSLVESDTS